MKPDEIRVAASRRISIEEFSAMPDRAIEIIKRDLRTHVAHHIVDEKIKESRDDFFFEMRIDLYVASPETFWKIVHEEAERIALRYKI